MKKIAVDNRRFTCEAEFVISDSLPELIVKDETNRLIYKSNDGGKTWERDSKPPVHISIENVVVSRKDDKVTYAVYNNTSKGIDTGRHFKLQKWNGKKWVKCPETEELFFTDDAILVNPNGSWTTYFGLKDLKLGAGKYKLITKESADNRQFTCETVFVLE